MRKKIRLFIVLLIGVMIISACGGSDGDKKRITVGSKHFTETFILAEMMAYLLEDNGFEVDRVIPLGGTEVAQQALQNTEIDLYPEYTSGAIITGVLGLENDPPITVPEEAYEVVKKEFKEQFNIEVLEPFGFNNNYALLVREEFAQENRISSISELESIASDMTAGFTHEFTGRTDGYVGFKEMYGFEFGNVSPLDSGLLYDALKNEEVDIISGFATDARIVEYNLKSLDDEKGFLAPQLGVPLLRGEIVEQYPEVVEIINQLAGKLSDETMQQLNYQVDIEGKEPSEVAMEFLKKENLIE